MPDTIATQPVLFPEESQRGSRALVTGSTRGIGLGVAAALLRAGCEVMLNGRAEEGALVLSHLGGRAAFQAADLRHAEACAQLVAACEARFGGVDILVNNAGVQHVAPLESFPDAQWDDIVALNLSAEFRTVRAAVPGMRARGFGRIVNIASVHGLVARERKSPSVAAKHGLVGLTKAIALETVNDGITCNAICPGWVRTDLVEAQVARPPRNCCAPSSQCTASPRRRGSRRWSCSCARMLRRR
jgi:3-hydroxybutyrate dehydrogenase